MPRPEFDTAFHFWTALLAERGLAQDVRWVFFEDACRLPKTGTGWRFAFRPRPGAEADKIARFAYAHLDPARELAFVAYAILDGSVITGFQGDLFTASDDVYREDWNIYFDAGNHLMSGCELIADASTWHSLWKKQPDYLSELDYLVSVSALERNFGYSA